MILNSFKHALDSRTSNSDSFGWYGSDLGSQIGLLSHRGHEDTGPLIHSFHTHTPECSQQQVQIIDAWHQNGKLHKIHLWIKIIHLCMDLSDCNIYHSLK